VRNRFIESHARLSLSDHARAARGGWVDQLRRG
jgi:hypothetical protein